MTESAVSVLLTNINSHAMIYTCDRIQRSQLLSQQYTVRTVCTGTISLTWMHCSYMSL